MCKIILNNWDFSVLKSFLRALYLQILSDNPIFLSYIPKIQLIKLSSIALVAKFIKFYYARSFVEIVQYSIIQLWIVAILAKGATTTTCFVHFVKFSPFYGLIRTFLHQKLSHMCFKDTRRFVLQSAFWKYV